MPRYSLPHIGFGLRPRLLGALALTSVVTLGVAALALLPPLKSRLRSDATYRAKTAVVADKAAFGHISHPYGPGLRHEIGAQARLLKEYRVDVWSLGGTPVYYGDQGVPPSVTRPIALAAASSRRDDVVSKVAESDRVLVVATVYRDDSRRLVLELVARLDYVQEATNVVSVAFIEAAAAGLLVAMLLGVALSSRLVRRLRLLRDATIGLDEHGLSDLVVADAGGRDEIGEVARAFSRMRDRLRQQEDARRAFVATASHELRTPLTSLDGMLELIADDLENDPVDLDDARARVARAQEQSRRLSSLASDLLDLSRMDAALELRSDLVELGELARAVIAEFELRALDGDIDIVVEGSDSHHWTEGDPAGLARIVRILLDNALRIAPRHSTITVSVESGGDFVELEVADDGPGVPPDERDLIFERFQRGRDHRSEVGFGLGLAIGRELAMRMGGTLQLRGNPPGARFRLRLAAVPVGVQVE